MNLFSFLIKSHTFFLIQFWAYVASCGSNEVFFGFALGAPYFLVVEAVHSNYVSNPLVQAGNEEVDSKELLESAGDKAAAGGGTAAEGAAGSEAARLGPDKAAG